MSAAETALTAPGAEAEWKQISSYQESQVLPSAAGNGASPPQCHITRVGTKAMAKGSEERQKGMKPEEGNGRRNEKLRPPRKAERMA